MKRIGFFVDVSNLYYCVAKQFKGGRLDYRLYYDFVKDFGDIVVATAYGAEIGDQAERFKRIIRKIGFETKYKPVRKQKADCDVNITIDIVNRIKEFDLIVLGSADGALEPLVTWCIAQGVDVIIIACGISSYLKATESIEIPASLVKK